VTKEKEIADLQKQFDQVDVYIQSGVKKVLTLLSNEKYIETHTLENISIKLTFMGSMATHLREVHCLIFARLLEDKMLNDLSSKQLVSFFSCFTNINISDDLKDHAPKTEDKKVKALVLKVSELYAEYQNKEIQYNINSGSEYNIHYDLLNYVEKWCNCENAGECKLLLQQLASEKDIFLGEFVKALLKINNISNEMEKIAELIGNIEFLSKLREIPVMTMKYVVTNQSLYV
jgi:superfamily II RNA helicase